MAEKNKKKTINGDEQEKNETDHKKKKEKNDNVTVVLTADLHCEGCVSKVLKCIRSFDGVEKASIGDRQRITVVGKVDPLKLRERLEKKTHKKVEIISPPLKKDPEGREEDSNAGGNDGKNEKKKKKKEIKGKNSEKRNDAKKSKEIELPVTTAVLRVHLHCHGCTQKIYRLVTKTKGYQDMKIDKQKELVTVTGAMDINALAKLLKKHLKKEVEILPPPKKEVEHKDNKGGDKAKGGGDKGKIGGDGGGVDKGKIFGGGSGGGGVVGGGEKKAGGGEKAEGNKSKFQTGHPDPIVYGSSGVVVVEQFQYNPCELGSYHAPQIFSDENPNACSVM